MNRCLIAGAGDLGLRCARSMVDSGWEVVALRRSKVTVSAVRAHQGDLRKPETWSGLGEFDACLYCPTPDRRDESAYRETFVAGLANLLDSQLTPYVLFVSSTAVYAQDQGEEVDEASPTAPSRFNGKVLLEAEQMIGETGGVLRLAGIYGPGRDYLIRSVRQGKPARIGYWTNRIHIDDAAAAAAMLLQRRHRAVLNGVDDVPALDTDVREFLAAELGLTPPPRVSSDSLNKRVSAAKLRGLGFRAQYPSYREGYVGLCQATETS